MKLGYFPGCSLHSTGAEYDISFRAICKRLNVELEELKGWICCGTTAAHINSNLLAAALPMQNLVQAQKQGFSEIAVPCTACHSRFKRAVYETGHDSKLKADVEDVIGSACTDNVVSRNPLEILDCEEQLDKIKNASTVNMSGLKVACYYGCVLTRPPKVMQFDECEYPMSMDRILRAAGMETLDWNYKTDCCGASLSLTRTDVVLKLTKDVLADAKAVGADAIAVACTMCQVNADTRQEEINAEFKTDFDIPVLYFSQLLGLAFGMKPDDLAMNRHLVDATPLLKSKGVLN